MAFAYSDPAGLIRAFSEQKALTKILAVYGCRWEGTAHRRPPPAPLSWLLTGSPPSAHSTGMLRRQNEGNVDRGVGGSEGTRGTVEPARAIPVPARRGEKRWGQGTGAHPHEQGHGCRDEQPLQPWKPEHGEPQSHSSWGSAFPGARNSREMDDRAGPKWAFPGSPSSPLRS